MKIDEAIHICRNPYGFSEQSQRLARLLLCDEFERYKEALSHAHGLLGIYPNDDPLPHTYEGNSDA